MKMKTAYSLPEWLVYSKGSPKKENYSYEWLC